MEKSKVFLYFLLIPLFVFSIGLENGKAIALEKGKDLFRTNCIVCHIRGTNIIIPEKNLQQEALDENGMNSLSAISYQILNGKNGMPAFSGRLTEIEIESIAKYVLEESSTNFENEIEPE